MGQNVYANGMEIASQESDTKVVAAFPDVCMSPPPPPAGPVPVPYPNTSSAKSLKDGSKTVLIGSKPLALKDSYFQSSPLGNEAATHNFGASVITHTITGKTYFQAHSMDVVVEGKNVCRHLDVTTSNHGSYPGGTPPFPNMGEMQQLALGRLAQKQCPCCGSDSCAAAFQESDEPLSMKEAMGIDKNSPNYRPRRAEEHELLLLMKKENCTCGGKTFPSPPCDVFRKPNKERHAAIENQWDEDRRYGRYKMWYMNEHGVQLHDSTHFMANMKQMYSPEELHLMEHAMTRPRAQRANDPWAKKFEEMQTKAKKLERINHLTPKEYGGCPTNPGNLQPQQTLCITCQQIDQFMTDSWQTKA